MLTWLAYSFAALLMLAVVVGAILAGLALRFRPGLQLLGPIEVGDAELGGLPGHEAEPPDGEGVRERRLGDAHVLATLQVRYGSSVGPRPAALPVGEGSSTFGGSSSGTPTRARPARARSRRSARLVGEAGRAPFFFFFFFYAQDQAVGDAAAAVAHRQA